MYVEELIGPDTVNTLPPATIEAFQDHGRVERTIDRDVEEAYQTVERLSAHGIELREVTDKLLRDGIEIFTDSFRLLDEAIQGKREELLFKQQTACTARV